MHKLTYIIHVSIYIVVLSISQPTQVQNQTLISQFHILKREKMAKTKLFVLAFSLHLVLVPFVLGMGNSQSPSVEDVVKTVKKLYFSGSKYSCSSLVCSECIFMIVLLGSVRTFTFFLSLCMFLFLLFVKRIRASIE